MKLTWRQGTPAPENKMCGAAVVHGTTTYFSHSYSVYSYMLSEDKWTKLKQCEYQFFSMAVIDNRLTTIGGWDACVPSNSHYHPLNTTTSTILSLSRSSSEMNWEKLLPPMPTARMWPAAVTTPTHLIVAGGRKKFGGDALIFISCGNTGHQHP